MLCEVRRLLQCGCPAYSTSGAAPGAESLDQIFRPLGLIVSFVQAILILVGKPKV